ncbi:hypothetical protein F511_42258 [Dorcoceras hygrometricum]|uniref:Uncharacterized protein n=1 Tax=Dorcoceras hygrometricum TaxID=472368 RepID=A0A2Z7CYD9_9LAMI|nr:hypothetical protein F511_42258 [Dorcoceras hygrometricum]
MEHVGIVAMFGAIVVSGLKEFLGCPTVIYEAALIEFFQNGSVRDGKVVSTIQGTTVEISEEVFAGTFKLPMDGLIDLNEVPKDLVFDARSIFSFTGEQLSTSCKKREMKIEFRLLSDILAKSITVKAGSFDAVTHERFLMMAAINEESKLTGADDLQLISSEADRMFETGSDTSEELDTDMGDQVTAAEITKIKFGLSVEINEVQDKDWYYASLPKISANEKGKELMETDDVVKGNPSREMVQLICGDVEFLVQLREHVIQDVVNFFHSFSLSQIVDLESVRDIAAKEKHMLIWAKTNSLETAVKRRVYIIVKYKEMLLRKFLESHRKYFAPGQPWTAMASQIIDLLSAAHLKSLEELLAQKQEHGLVLERPCSSSLLADSADGRDAVLAQFYSLDKSTCWVRPMVLIDGVWTPIQGNDYWRSSCRLSLFVNKQQLPKRAIEDSFVPHCYFIEPDQYWGASQSIIKSWGWFKVCTEVVQFFDSGKLLPVGSLNFCRDLTVVNPVSDSGFQRPTVTTLGWSQLCTALVRFSLVSGLQTVDIRNFLSVLVPVRPVTTVSDSVVQQAPVLLLTDTSSQEEPSVQIAPASVPIVSGFDQGVQLDISQRPDSPTPNADSSLHFSSEDTPLEDDTTHNQISLPAISTSLTEYFAQLRALIDRIQFEQIRRKDDTDKLRDVLLMHIRDLEKKFSTSFDQQDRAYRILLNRVRQEIHDQKTTLSLDFLTSQKKLSTQVAAVATKLVDV